MSYRRSARGRGSRRRKDPVKKLVDKLERAWKDYLGLSSAYQRGETSKAKVAKALVRVRRLEKVLGVDVSVVTDSVA